MYADWIIRFRHAIILVVTVITAGMAISLKDLKVNADVMSYLPDEDPSALLFNRIGETYGGNETVIVGLETHYGHVFTKEMLEQIKQVTDSIRSVPGIGYVTSLTNVIDIRSTEYGIEIGRLIDEYDIPGEKHILDSLKAYTLSKEMYRGNLVSDDATATLVSGKILPDVNRAEVVELIRKKLDGIPFEGNIYYGGMPVTLQELARIIIRDIVHIAPMAFVLISLVLFAGFRNVRGVLLPMLSVLIAIIWTLGFIVLLGYELTLMTNVIPVILIAVGSAYAIHVVNAVMAGEQMIPRIPLRTTLSRIVIPVTLAAATTILGFLSFIAGSYLTMIRQFGFFSALGILFCMILSVTFIPAILSVIDKGDGPFKKNMATPEGDAPEGLPDSNPYDIPGSNPYNTSDGNPQNIPVDTAAGVTRQNAVPSHPFERIAMWLSTLVFHHKKPLLATWTLLVAVSILGVTQIERRVEIIDYFRKDNIVRKSDHLLKEKFHGSSPLFLKVTGDVQSPDVLQMMDRAQEYMSRFDYIPYSLSVADLIKQMNDVMGEGSIIPDDELKIAQLWFLLDGQEIMEQLVSRDLREGIIQGFVTSNDMDVLQEIESNFEAFAAANRTDSYELAVTGVPIMFKRLDNSIITSQTYSLIIAIILVMLMISLLLRSFISGLIAIVPIGVTLFVLFGTMGITGIPLDIATVLTGSVTIGIGIDYSIHFISRFGEGQNRQIGVKQRLERAMHISGRAIFINMIAVSLGFAMLMFSNLAPLQRFGFLIAVTMLVAGMATLTLLPILLLQRRPIPPE